MDLGSPRSLIRSHLPSRTTAATRSSPRCALPARPTRLIPFKRMHGAGSRFARPGRWVSGGGRDSTGPCGPGTSDHQNEKPTGMTPKEQVEQLLSGLVSGAVFEIPRKGVVRSHDVRLSYRRRQSLDPTWAQADEKTLRVDRALLCSLTGSISSLLAEFTNPSTGRIGNGLFDLTGGLSTRATLLPEEFAKMMVVGAVRLGPQRATAHLFDWIDGAPLRSKLHILVEGIRIDQAIGVHGVELSMLAGASVELPFFLSHSALRRDTVPAQRIRDAAVVSLDLEHRPALYRPEDDIASFGFDRLRTEPVNADLSDTSVEAFCEAMMLACGRYVPWLASWGTDDDAAAFMSSAGGGGSHRTNPRSAAVTADFSEAQLGFAIEICALRKRDAGRGTPGSTSRSVGGRTRSGDRAFLTG